MLDADELAGPLSIKALGLPVVLTLAPSADPRGVAPDPLLEAPLPLPLPSDEIELRALPATLLATELPAV